MVKTLHAAGIEVILDVVYNHTAEGNHLGPTLSFRGIDNPAYYRLMADDPRYYIDYTGTGNSLNMRHPHVLQLIMDSLRYWVTEMHVDGFRFDLASTLARELYDVDRLSAFFDLIQQDPVVVPGQADRRAVGRRRGRLPGRQLPAAVVGVERPLPRHGPRLLARRAGDAGRVRLPLHRQLRPLPGRHPAADGVDQLRHRPRRLHAARPRLLQRQAQRGQRRGEPRRRVAQPLVELRRRGADRRSRRHRPARPPAAQPGDHAVAVPGRADAPRRRRARPHPGRQQQRLLPGQRDLVVRLGRRRQGLPGVCQHGRLFRREPPRVPPPPVVPGPAHPRHRGPRLVPSRRGDDERRRLGQRLRPSLGVFLNGDGIPTTGRLWGRIVDDSFFVIFNAGEPDLSWTVPGGKWARNWMVELDTDLTHEPGTDVAAGSIIVAAGGAVDGRPARAVADPT